MRILSLLSVVFLSVSAPAAQWKWTDFEIVGNRTVSRADIARAIPLKLGEVYVEDPAQWRGWCDDLVRKFGFHYAECSPLRFLDFRTYLTVNIVEKGEEYRTRYRPAPTGTVAIKDPEVFALNDRLMARLFELFDKGINAGEHLNGDFVDFKDPQMHDLVLQLVKRAPLVRDNLIAIVGGHPDGSVRAKAAWSLCWARSPADSIARVFTFLDDPATLVRNDVSRFMSHWVDLVSDPKLQKPLLDVLVLQMKRPSHADRNKSLINLYLYLRAQPGAIPYFKSIGQTELDHIAANSVLENVGDTAKALQKLVSAP
jgi:hypothetical protein